MYGRQGILGLSKVERLSTNLYLLNGKKERYNTAIPVLYLDFVDTKLHLVLVGRL